MSNDSIRHLKEITTADVDAGKFRLEEITSNEVDGIILTDFLSAEEVEQIIAGFSATTKSERIQINEGFDSHPMTFAQFDQMSRAGVLTEADYFNSSQEFTQTFASRYGVDILNKLQSFIRTSSTGNNLEVPYPPEGSINYVPITFRELYPNKGMLKAHCENLFYKEFPGYFDRINKFSIKEDQLSFFVLLQEPEEGGELTLYDLIWNDKQNRNTDTEVDLGNGETISVEDPSFKRRSFKPTAGSLVVFSGGEIWHRVEMIRKSPSRITLGGFMSFSVDKRTLYCWS